MTSHTHTVQYSRASYSLTTTSNYFYVAESLQQLYTLSPLQVTMAEGGGVEQLSVSGDTAKTKMSTGPEFLETPEGRQLAYHRLPGEKTSTDNHYSTLR